MAALPQRSAQGTQLSPGSRIWWRISFGSSASQARGRYATFLGLLVFFLFAALRFGVYAAIPAPSFEAWIVRDTVMDMPRLLALALSLRIGLLHWGRIGLGLHLQHARKALALSLLFFGVWYPPFWFRATPYDMRLGPLLVLSASSVLVALWEEILYRGVLLNSLRDWLGTRAALWGSSLLFTIMHVQAQPIGAWPSVFLVGVVFALMRIDGIALTWIICFHWALDSFVYLGAHGEPTLSGVDFICLALEALFVVVYLLYLGARRDKVVADAG